MNEYLGDLLPSSTASVTPVVRKINDFLINKVFESNNREHVKGVIGHNYTTSKVINNKKLASFDEFDCKKFESHYGWKEIQCNASYSEQFGSVMDIGVEFKCLKVNLKKDTADWIENTHQKKLIMLNRIFTQEWSGSGSCKFKQPLTDLGKGREFIQSCTLAIGYQLIVGLESNIQNEKNDQNKYSLNATFNSLAFNISNTTGGKILTDKCTNYKVLIKPLGDFVPPVLDQNSMSLMEYVQKIDQSFSEQLDSQKSHCAVFIDEKKNVLQFPFYDPLSSNQPPEIKINIENAHKISDVDLFKLTRKISANKNNEEFFKRRLKIKENNKSLNLNTLCKNLQNMLYEISFTSDRPLISAGPSGSGKSTLIAFGMEIPLESDIRKRRGGNGEEKIAIAKGYRCFLTSRTLNELTRGIYVYKSEDNAKTVIYIVHSDLKVSSESTHTKLGHEESHNNMELLSDTISFHELKKNDTENNLLQEIEAFECSTETKCHKEINLSDNLIEYIIQHCRNCPKIGATKHSETTIPHLHMLSGGGLIYDTVGYPDNRGREFNIINQFGLECIAQHNSGNFGPVVIFIDTYEFFRNKIKGLTALSKLLSSLFVNPEAMSGDVNHNSSFFIIVSNKSQCEASEIEEDVLSELKEVYDPLYHEYGDLIKKKSEEAGKNAGGYTKQFVDIVKGGCSIVKEYLSDNKAGPSEQQLMLLSISGMLVKRFKQIFIFPNVFETEDRKNILKKLYTGNPCYSNEVCFGKIYDSSIHVKDIFYLIVNYANNLIEQKIAKEREKHSLHAIIKTTINLNETLYKLSIEISKAEQEFEKNNLEIRSINSNKELVPYGKKWDETIVRGFWQWGNSDAHAIKYRINLLSPKSEKIEDPHNGTIESFITKEGFYEAKFWASWCWVEGSPNVKFKVPYNLLETSIKRCSELKSKNETLENLILSRTLLKSQIEKTLQTEEKVKVLKSCGTSQLMNILKEIRAIDAEIRLYSPLFSQLYNFLTYENSLFFDKIFRSQSQMVQEELEQFYEFINTMKKHKMPQDSSLSSISFNNESVGDSRHGLFSHNNQNQQNVKLISSQIINIDHKREEHETILLEHNKSPTL